MDLDGGRLAAHLIPGGSRLPARRDAPHERGDPARLRQATQRVPRPVLLKRRTAARGAMIAGVKGPAVLSALLILLPRDARAADDMAGAVRELARKTAALAGRSEERRV